MKLILSLILLLTATVTHAQVSSVNAKRIYSGTAVPTFNCSPGPSYRDVYIRTSTGVWYQCTAAPNTWAAISSGGITNSAGANVITKSDGTNLVASILTDDGTNVAAGDAKTISADSARIGDMFDTYAGFWHTSIDGNKSTRYALAQDTSGATFLNSVGTLSFRISNVEVGTMSATSTVLATAGVTLSHANYQSCTALTTDGSGVIGCTASDARLKSRFNPFVKGLAALRQVTPQSYVFTAEPTRQRWGFVAQNVEASIPEAVSATGNGTLQVDNVTMTAVLVNAVKELEQRVIKLERENRKLRRRR